MLGEPWQVGAVRSTWGLRETSMSDGNRRAHRPPRPTSMSVASCIYPAGVGTRYPGVLEFNIAQISRTAFPMHFIDRRKAPYREASVGPWVRGLWAVALAS